MITIIINKKVEFYMAVRLENACIQPKPMHKPKPNPMHMHTQELFVNKIHFLKFFYMSDKP